MRFYSSKQLEGILKLSARYIRRLAETNNWAFRLNKNKKEYDFKSFDDDIKIKILDHIKKSKSITLDEQLSIKNINLKDLEVGKMRAYLIAMSRDYKTPRIFCGLYNMGEITVPDGIREKYPTLSERTLYHWQEKSWVGDECELSSKYNRGQKAGNLTMTDEEIATAHGIYLKYKSFKIAKTFRKFKEIYPESKATYNTFCRVINEIPQAARDLLKKGKKYYNDKYSPFVEMDFSRYNVMEYWDSDHHQFDAFVVDESGSVYRPWLTVFQDMRSRKIVGWHIGRIASSFSIASAFRNAIVKCGGAPKLLKIDNGKDYKGKHLQGYTIKINKNEEINIAGLFKRFGVDCIFATPYHGQAKPIESFFKTMIDDFVVELPTYSKSNTISTIKEHNELWKEIVKKIRGLNFTESKLIDRFEKWVTKWNATHKHRGNSMNGRTPDEVFNAGLWIATPDGSQRRVGIEIPESNLDYIFDRDFLVTVQRNGIVIDKISYYNPKLIKYKGKGIKVIAKRNITDIGKISVFSIDGDFICDATSNVFKDIGVTEENIKNVKRQQRTEREIIKQYEELANNIKTEEEKIIIEAANNKKRTTSAVSRKDEKKESEKKYNYY